MKYTSNKNAIILITSFILIKFLNIYFKSKKLFNCFSCC